MVCCRHVCISMCACMYMRGLFDHIAKSAKQQRLLYGRWVLLQYLCVHSQVYADVNLYACMCANMSSCACLGILSYVTAGPVIIGAKSTLLELPRISIFLPSSPYLNMGYMCYGIYKHVTASSNIHHAPVMKKCMCGLLFLPSLTLSLCFSLSVFQGLRLHIFCAGIANPSLIQSAEHVAVRAFARLSFSPFLPLCTYVHFYPYYKH
jgi:hypothetical protein